ncbi:MAG: M15 family metallopeptidase [Spirochaetales bacterium]|nr:M15 family metallopeptidase [Spirochaetales bacterium]
MKHLPVLAAAGLLFVLTGISCETTTDPDAPYRVETTGSAEAPSTVVPKSTPQPPAAEASGERREGQAEMGALARAYPDRIDRLAFRDDDWALRIGDTWYFWAHGRLLPEQLRDRWEEYASYRFYSYSLDLPPLPILDEEAKARLKQRLEQADSNPPRRHGGFLDDLYEAATRGQTEVRLVTVRLMGLEVRVHEQISRPLKAVAGELEELVRTDEEVQRFVAGLKGLAGYNWREIAGTRSRSYHSYGIAVDLAPKSFGGRHTYWRWALPHAEEWYAIPYERRWMVPQQIVRVFEKHGFVWGGKWFYFDTMHFEYRLEIFILAESRSSEGE